MAQIYDNPSNPAALQDIVEKLRRTQELPVQSFPKAPDVPEASQLKMPEMGSSFKAEQAASIAKQPGLGELETASPASGMDYNVAKAAVDSLGGAIQAYMQSQFLGEETKKEAEGKAKTAVAKGRAESAMATGKEQFGGLSGLMDVYRGVYGKKMR